MAICLLVSILFILLLSYFSVLKEKHSNNFIRLLPSGKLSQENVLELKGANWYIAGAKNEHIFMGNLRAPDRILQVGISFKDTLGLKLRFPNDLKIFEGYTNQVENDSIYTLDGNQPALYSGNLKSLSSKYISKPPFFTQGIYSGCNIFVFRVVQSGKNWLVRYRPDSLGFKKPKNLLEKQVDGIFCTDGNLIKVPNSNKIIYVYYYRNQFIFADDNLNLIYRGKTIDTVTHAHIKVAYIKSTNQTTLASPPLFVNKQSTANEKYLFIHSALIADNEVAESLDKVSVIDVYAIKDGKYQFSFYLPDIKKSKVRDFKVHEQSLYALYDHYLYKYRLNF